MCISCDRRGAGRGTVFTDQNGIVNLLFPTGIAFFAGDTLTVDLTDRSGTATLYGHLQKS